MLSDVDVPTERGREDPKIGIKTTLHAEEDSVHTFMPSIAVLGGLTLPFGSTAFNGIHAQPEAKLALSWTTTTPLSIYSNLGVGAVFDGTDWGERGWVSTALWYTVSEKVSVFLEGISTRSLGGTALSSNAVDSGITYLVNDRFQVDYRIGHGFGIASSQEKFFGVGFALRF